MFSVLVVIGDAKSGAYSHVTLLNGKNFRMESELCLQDVLDYVNDGCVVFNKKTMMVLDVWKLGFTPVYGVPYIVPIRK